MAAAFRVYIVQGDEEPGIRVRVDNGEPAATVLAIDLSDVTSTDLEHSQNGVSWTTVTGGGSVEQGDVSDVDSAGTRFWYSRYDWTTGQTDALQGGYQVRMRMTRSGGNDLSAPSSPPWGLLIVSL